MIRSISVAVIVGSLRKESFTRRVAMAAMAHAPKAIQCRFVEIGDLPHYNQDLDGKAPAEWESFRAEIKKSDAVLFFTPEYNRSFPGHLKNAIDIASRPKVATSGTAFQRVSSASRPTQTAVWPPITRCAKHSCT